MLAVCRCSRRWPGLGRRAAVDPLARPRPPAPLGDAAGLPGDRPPGRGTSAGDAGRGRRRSRRRCDRRAPARDGVPVPARTRRSPMSRRRWPRPSGARHRWPRSATRSRRGWRPSGSRSEADDLGLTGALRPVPAHGLAMGSPRGGGPDSPGGAPWWAFTGLVPAYLLLVRPTRRNVARRGHGPGHPLCPAGPPSLPPGDLAGCHPGVGRPGGRPVRHDRVAGDRREFARRLLDPVPRHLRPARRLGGGGADGGCGDGGCGDGGE